MTTESMQTTHYSRLSTNRLGLWLFIISEATIFVALLFARFYLQGTNRPDELNQTIGLIITSLLLISSLTAYRAESSIAHGDRAGFLRNTLLTLVLGFVFLAGVGMEWSEAFRRFPPSTGFGTVFFRHDGHARLSCVNWDDHAFSALPQRTQRSLFR